MRLGIDFGTTRIVVSAADRGNYPVAAFECADGASREWYPPLIAIRGGQRWYGWDAWALQGTPGCVLVRSIKRCLAGAGPHSRMSIGSSSEPLFELLTGLVSALKRDLIEKSSLHVKPGEALEVFLGVPANANGNQRFLTVEAFRQAGFEVLGLLNEPSAASIEYSHKQSGGKPSAAETVLVYDLGGGTFDASLVEREELSHAVTATEGISTLGGDDFDEVLAELALESAGARIVTQRSDGRPGVRAAGRMPRTQGIPAPEHAKVGCGPGPRRGRVGFGEHSGLGVLRSLRAVDRRDSACRR